LIGSSRNREDAVLRRALDVLEAVAEVVRLRRPLGAAADAVQAVDDAPGEERPVLQARDPLEERERPRLLVRLDDDERKARFQDDREVALVVHAAARCPSAASSLA
jgi:hypothetical protein